MLDPPELGRIEVRLEMNQEGRLQAHLLADKQDTLDLMQRESKHLEKALGDLGVDTDSDSFEFSLRDEDKQNELARQDEKESWLDSQENRETEILMLPPEVNMGDTIDTYGFKVKQAVGISMQV